MNNCTSCGAATAPRRKYCDDCRDTAAPWRVHIDAVSRALSEFDIVLPVDIRRCSGNGQTRGRYHGVAPVSDSNTGTVVMCHRITVAARLHPDDASRVIWHELTHVSQFERDPDYARKYQLYDYWSNPFETEAKANERYHDTKFSLTLANRRANMRRTNHPRVAEVVDGRIVDGKLAARSRQHNLTRIRNAEVALGR